MNILNKKNWTSKEELINNLHSSQYTIDTIEHVISNLTLRRPMVIIDHIDIKKRGYHKGYLNSEVFYDDYLVNMIKAELSKHNTNQNTGAIQKQMSTEAKEQGILLNDVINSGDLKTAQDLCDLIMKKTEIQAEFKRMSEQTKQMEKEIKRQQICYTIANLNI